MTRAWKPLPTRLALNMQGPVKLKEPDIKLWVFVVDAGGNAGLPEEVRPSSFDLCDLFYGVCRPRSA